MRTPSARILKGLTGTSSIANGLHVGQFDALDAEVKAAIITLLSRTEEAAFRRGFQHGYEIPRQGQQIVDPVRLRFGRVSLDLAPSTISGHRWCITSVHRLFMEHSILEELGLWPEDYRDERVRSPARLARSKAPGQPFRLPQEEPPRHGNGGVRVAVDATADRGVQSLDEKSLPARAVSPL